MVRVGMVKSSYDTFFRKANIQRRKLFKKKDDRFPGVYLCLTTTILPCMELLDDELILHGLYGRLLVFCLQHYLV